MIFIGALVKLNPYALALRRQELKGQEARTARKVANAAVLAKGGKVVRTDAEKSVTKARKAHLLIKKQKYTALMDEEYYSLAK